MQANKLIPKLRRAAKQYAAELEGRSFLLVGQSLDPLHAVRLLEVSFSDVSFQHLVGIRFVSRNLGARDFYERCLAGRLSGNELEEISRGWATIKLNVAPLLFRSDLGATMFGMSNESHLLLHTDMMAGNVRGAMGFVHRNHGNLVPNTLINEDIRRNITDLHQVIAVFRKDKRESQYAQLTKLTSPSDWESVAPHLPSEYAYLMQIVSTCSSR